jgi:pyruvate ferredoxin oxidoreductase alpha subunit
MTETPIVLLEAQRAGPSTGMPTKPEQADLEHVLYTSQGDSHRVVFAPGNQKEAYEMTRRAFQIAYEYHIPTVVLYDQKLSGEYRNVPEAFFDGEPNADPGAVLRESEIEDAPHDSTGTFHRYRHDPENGVSPRSVPGQSGGRYLASGNEHNESGHISEDPQNRTNQVQRRQRKLGQIRTELSADDGVRNTHHGDEDAEYAILTWGTHQGTINEAVDRLNEDGTTVKSLSVGEMVPFPNDEVKDFVRSVDEVLVVEMNATAQFHGHVQRNLGEGGRKLSSLLKYNGNPFEPREIVQAVELELAGEEADPTAETHLEPATGD